jgi:LysR family glycine cleavage system transcriptional activator
MPPLAALRAFAAYAEEGSVVSAGATLNVSHAAISQQLRALEHHLDVALFNRTGRSLTLTAEGDQLARALSLGFGAIAAAVDELQRSSADRPVHVSATPSFTASWLMPRLAGFSKAHPEVDLTLDPSPQLVELTHGGVDVALRFGKGPWKGLDAELLLESPLVIVAAPSLLKGTLPTTPADLADYPWLEELGTTEASNWLRSRGVDKITTRGRVQVPGNLRLDGARDGQGVAVAVRCFVEADLSAGRLVELFSDNDWGGYHIVTRPGVLRPAVKAFVQWLRRQKQV